MAKSKGFGTLMGMQSSVRPLIIYWVMTIVPFVLLLSIFHSQISAHIGNTISSIQSRVCLNAAIPSSHDVVFYDYDEFQSLSSATDSAWNNLLTPNGGMLYSIDTSGRRVGRGISMFHQLHCLSMVRSKLQSLSGPDAGSERHHSAGERHDYAHNHHDLDNDHVLHCLDYIRQVRRWVSFLFH